MSKYTIEYSSPDYILTNTDTGVIIKKDPDRDVVNQVKEDLEKDED